MSYVQGLRAIVGKRPLILVSAGVLLLNRQGDLLLQRRADDALWGIPGGSLEIGESTEEAARREVREETGLVVGEMTLFGVFSGREMLHTYPNGDEAAIVAVVYQAHVNGSDVPVNGSESLELRFFSPDELPLAELSTPNRPIIRRFLQVQVA